MPKRNTALYLKDIETSIKRIEKYAKGLSFNSFKNDQKTVDAVIRNLEVIGEAVSNIPKEFKARYSDIPWRKIIDMRNKVIHEYFGVDFEILWETIQEDIPELKKKINKIKI